MSASGPDTPLSLRLSRLTGEAPSCSVREYAGEAEAILAGRGFRRALRRHHALSEEHRLLAVTLLKRRGELCACEVQAATGLTHATVSHHMGLLQRAGIVEGRRQGKWMYYRLRSSEVDDGP